MTLEPKYQKFGNNNYANGKPGEVKAKLEDEKPNVKKTDMDEDMQEFCISTALFAICYKCDNDSQISTYIKKEMDKKYTAPWHCIVGSSFGYHVSHNVKNYIHFCTKDKIIVIFKTV